jgi:hypothetical protein
MAGMFNGIEDAGSSRAPYLNGTSNLVVKLIEANVNDKDAQYGQWGMGLTMEIVKVDMSDRGLQPGQAVSVFRNNKAKGKQKPADAHKAYLRFVRDATVAVVSSAEGQPIGDGDVEKRAELLVSEQQPYRGTQFRVTSSVKPTATGGEFTEYTFSPILPEAKKGK